MQKSIKKLALLTIFPCLFLNCPQALSQETSRQDSESLATYNFDPNFALEKASFTMPRGQKLAYLYPKDFHETVIATDAISTISYSEISGRILISIVENKLTSQEFASLLKDETFYQGELEKFGDKEHLLWGEYEILNYQKDSQSADLLLKGFLKKPADGFLPDQHNFFYQRSILKNNTLVKMTCQVQGSQAQAAESQMLFNIVEDKFSQMANSLDL